LPGVRCTPRSVDPDRLETVGVVEMVVHSGMMTLKIAVPFESVKSVRPRPEVHPQAGATWARHSDSLQVRHSGALYLFSALWGGTTS
jgi:hypothetical protein